MAHGALNNIEDNFRKAYKDLEINDLLQFSKDDFNDNENENKKIESMNVSSWLVWNHMGYRYA